MVNLLPAVYSLSGLALMDLSGAVNIRGPLGNILGFSDFDADKMSLEFGRLSKRSTVLISTLISGCRSLPAISRACKLVCGS